MKNIILLISVSLFAISCIPTEKINKKTTNSDSANAASTSSSQVTSSTSSVEQYKILISDVTPTSFKAHYAEVPGWPYYILAIDSVQVQADRNIREYTFKNLTPGKTYSISGMMIWPDKSQPNRNIPAVSVTTPQVTTPAKLSKPVISSVSANQSSASINISAVSKATSYEYSLYKKSGSSFVLFDQKSTSGTSTSFNNLSAGTTYRFNVIAKANGHTNSDAASKEFETQAAPTPQPTTPPIASEELYKIHIRDLTPTSFKAYYAEVPGWPYYILAIDSAQVHADRNIREYSFKNLTPGKTYSISGMMIWPDKSQPNKNIPVVSVTTPQVATPIKLAKVNISNVSATQSAATINISAVSKATSYDYLLHKKNGANYVLFAQRNSTKTSESFNNLSAGSDYRFSVIAKASGYTNSDAANKEFSTQSAPTPTPVPTQPPTQTLEQYKIHISDISSTSLKASYAEVPGWPYYILAIDGVQVQSDRNIRDYTFKNLTPGKSYTITGMMIWPDKSQPNRNIPSVTVTLPASGNVTPPPVVVVPTPTPTPVPTTPPVNLSEQYKIHITDMGSTSFKASYAEVPGWPYYILAIDGVQVHADRNIRDYTFKDLTPGKTYSVSGMMIWPDKSYPTRNIPAVTITLPTSGNVTPPPVVVVPTPTPEPPVVGPTPIPPVNNGEQTAIESFGANPFYTGTKFFGNLTIQYLAANRSRITYNGSDSPFTSEYIGKEFVAFRAHENPENIDNNINYYPRKITARYSKVLSVVSGKVIEVDFGYNGGNISAPRTLTSASGYFFFDNRVALKNAFNSSNRNINIVLQSGKTYVTKGAWEATPVKELNIISSSTSESSAIKISMEDAFQPIQEDALAEPSFKKTYGSGTFFNLHNNNISIRFKDIDLLSTFYSIKQNQPVSSLFFNHIYSADNNCRVVRELSVTNSDSLKEFKEIKDRNLQLPQGYFPNMPGFASSLCGGQDDGKDVTHFQEFKLINTDWVASTVITIKNNYFRAGNLLIAKGEASSKRSKIYSTIDGALKSIPNITIRFEKDESGEYRKVRLLSKDITPFEMSNLYWDGGLSSGELHTFNMPEGSILFGGARDFDYYEGTRRWPRDLIIDSRTLRVAEAVPVLGRTYKALAVLASNKIRLDGVIAFVNDEIVVSGVRRKIIAVSRGTDRKEENKVGSYIDATLDGNISNNLSYSFAYSQSQKLIAGTGAKVDFTYNDDVIGYLTYTSKKLNFIYENIELRGAMRASSHMESDSDNKTLYKQAKYMIFKNSGYTTSYMADRGGAANEFRDSRDLYNRSKLTGQPHYVIIDNSRVYWSRINHDVNEIMLKNHPTLLYGNTSVGGPRFVGGIYQDGQGFTIDTGGADEFQFEAINGKDWNLSNIRLANSGLNSGLTMRLGGYGSINLSGLKRVNNSVNAYPTIVLGYPHAWSLRENGNLSLYASSGEGAIGQILGAGAQDHHQLKKDASEVFVDFKNWKLGPGLFCDGNCFPSQWASHPNIKISP